MIGYLIDLVPRVVCDIFVAILAVIVVFNIIKPKSHFLTEDECKRKKLEKLKNKS